MRLKDNLGRFWVWHKRKTWTISVQTRLRYLTWIGNDWDEIAKKLSSSTGKTIRASACKTHASKMKYRRSPLALSCIKSKASAGHVGRRKPLTAKTPDNASLYPMPLYGRG